MHDSSLLRAQSKDLGCSLVINTYLKQGRIRGNVKKNFISASKVRHWKFAFALKQTKKRRGTQLRNADLGSTRPAHSTCCLDAVTISSARSCIFHLEIQYSPRLVPDREALHGQHLLVLHSHSGSHGAHLLAARRENSKRPEGNPSSEIVVFLQRSLQC